MASRTQAWLDALLSRQQIHFGVLGFSGVTTSLTIATTLLVPYSTIYHGNGRQSTIPLWRGTAIAATVDVLRMAQLWIEGNTGDNVGYEAHVAGAVFGSLYYAIFLRGYGGVWEPLKAELRIWRTQMRRWWRQWGS